MRAEILWAGALVLFVVGCESGRGWEEPGAERSDPADRAATEVGRERIVSLLPGATGILVELGVRDRFVARSRADTVLLGDPELPGIGDPIDPALEVLADVAPSLVVAWRGMETERLRRVLPSGARILALEITDLGTLDRAIQALGEAVGRRGRADELRRGLAADLGKASSARRASSGKKPVRPSAVVAWVVWHDPITLAGHGTFVNAILSAAGGQNVLDPGEGSWPTVGVEMLIRRAPDVIVWPEGGGIPPPPVGGGLWNEVPAFRQGRILRPSADRFHVPGTGSGRAASDLAHSLDSLMARSVIGAPEPPVRP